MSQSHCDRAITGIRGVQVSPSRCYRSGTNKGGLEKEGVLNLDTSDGPIPGAGSAEEEQRGCDEETAREGTELGPGEKGT